MRLRYFLFGVLATLLVVGGIRIGDHLLAPIQPNFGTSQPQIVPILLSNRVVNPPLHEVPPNWGAPKEFNGQPFYIIPIAAVEKNS